MSMLSKKNLALAGARTYVPRFEVLEDRCLLTGITVITSGFRLGLGTPSEPEHWVSDMTSAINSRLPVPDRCNEINLGRSTLTPGGTVPGDACPAFILPIWNSDAEGPLARIEIVETLTAALEARLTASASPLDLHFIGHSRGAVVNGAVLQALNNKPELHAKLGFVQMTTLDAHPSPAVFGDPTPTRAGIVDFADNYFQQLGLDEPFTTDFNGIHIAGADVEIRLDDQLDQWPGRDREHSEVHDWYHWTIDTVDISNPIHNDDALEHQELAFYASPNVRDGLYLPTAWDHGRRVGYFWSSGGGGLNERPAPTLSETQIATKVSSPAWSPDGKKIAFTSNRQFNNNEVYTMNADGTGVVRLTNSQVSEFTPTWSPDGTKIAFATDDPSHLKYSGIDVINADGTNQTRLFNDDATRPRWSPDGTKIAFTYRPNNPSVSVMNADGTNPTRLTTGHNIEWDPAWSPDSKRLAYSSYNGTDLSDIYIMDADGTNRVQVTNHRSSNTNAAWSPDGTKIAFIRNRTQIYLINTDGTNLIRLVESLKVIYELAWSPDGSKLAFTTSLEFEVALRALDMTGFTSNKIEFETQINVPAGATSAVQRLSNFDRSQLPAKIELPAGTVEYSATSLPLGAATVVTMYLPSEVKVNSFYKYGPTAEKIAPHWYEFLYDDATQTGAQIQGNVVTVHLVDGQRGDDDLQRNGRISDPGAPAFDTAPWHNYDFVEDVNRNGSVEPLDALNIINEINGFGSRQLPLTPKTLNRLLIDTTADGWVAPNDVLAVINYINAYGNRLISNGEGEQPAGIADYRAMWDLGLLSFLDDMAAQTPVKRRLY